MLQLGLLPELFGFFADALSRMPADLALPEAARQLNFTHGVLQAIGFKEFMPLLLHLLERGWEPRHAPSESEPVQRQWQQVAPFLMEPPAEAILRACVADLKAATARYARRQLAWINGRLLRGTLLLIRSCWNEREREKCSCGLRQERGDLRRACVGAR